MKLKGICPIIETPFTKTGEVDYDSLQNEVFFLAEGGCNAVTLFGIAGEYYKLSDEESKKMIKVVVDSCNKKGIPSIVSVTQHATELAIKSAKYYQDCGADSLMLMPPFFLKPSLDDIINHIKQVCCAVSIPVIIQYAPEHTGVSFSPEMLASLSNSVSNDLYFKIECKPAGAYITSLLSKIGDSGKVLIGNAAYQFIESLDRGAIGAMPGPSMFDIYITIYNKYVNGNREGAKQLHESIILPLLNNIFQNVEMLIAYEKRILCKRGVIETDKCRQPTFVSDPHYDKIFEEYCNMIKENVEDVIWFYGKNFKNRLNNEANRSRNA